MMKKQFAALATVLVLLLTLTGCSGSLKGLDAVPEGAKLVFSHTVDAASGNYVTYGSWLSGNNGESGTYVVEIACTGGRANDVKVEYSTAKGGGSAGLGNVARSTVILELEDFYAPGASYVFKIRKLDKFCGTLNVYFVPA